MAISIVQSSGQVRGENVSSLTLTLPDPPTPGNALIVVASLWNGGTPTLNAADIDDDGGNTYGVLQAPVQNGARAIIAYAVAVQTDDDPFDIVLTLAGGGYYVEAVAIEVAGLAASGQPDASGEAGAQSATPAVSTDGETTVGDALVVAVVQVSEGSTNVGLTSPATTGYTSLGLNQNAEATIGFEASAKIVSQTGVQSAAWGTLSGTPHWSAVIAAFAGAQAGGGGTVEVASSGQAQSGGSVTVSVGGQVDEGDVFSTDFESGTTAGFAEAPNIVVTSDIAMRGTYSARGAYAVADGPSPELRYYGFDGADALYMRSYEMRHGGPSLTDPTQIFYCPAGLKAGRVILQNGQGNLQLEHHQPSGSTHLQTIQMLNRAAQSIHPGGPDHDLPGPGLASFRWYCMEFQWVFATGECRFWLDGDLILEAIGADILAGATVGIEHFWWGGNASDATIGQGNPFPYTSYRHLDLLYANNSGVRHGPLPFVRNVVAMLTEDGVLLDWEAPQTGVLPSQAGFVDGGVLIRRRTDRFPLTVTDGVNPLGGTTRVAAGVTQYLDTGVEENETYFYTLWTYDANGVSQGPAYAQIETIAGPVAVASSGLARSGGSVLVTGGIPLKIARPGRSLASAFRRLSLGRRGPRIR